jgi:dihydropteroate synthase
MQKIFSINCNGKLLVLNEPKVMAIVNLTPDSFYPGSRFPDTKQALSHIDKVVGEGADIIDLGAYSSRPGAEHISPEMEWERLEPVLNAVRLQYPEVIISLDTFRSGIAQKAVTHFAVDMINDISGGMLDSQMFATIAKLKVPYIIMHMKGTPQTMQKEIEYTDLMKEVILYFSKSIRQLTNLGALDVIIDPGFGFAKTLDRNYELLARLDELAILDKPILVGLSRKSMIYKYLGMKPEDSLNGTSVVNTLAMAKGASIIRVHDVKEAKEVVNIFTKTKQFQYN